MKVKKQMSDTLLIGILLAIVGGFLDAYTYLYRGHVFANAQTGNIVLLGVHLIQGHYVQFIYYLFPILAFFIGIIIAEIIKKYYQTNTKIHWRQIVLLIEFFVLLIVSFLPQQYNMLCNIMVSFICSLQVQSFRKFNGHPYASTMCTGNLRSATEHLCQHYYYKNKDSLTKSLQYYMIIFFFIVGASLGAISIQTLQHQATCLPAFLLLLIIAFMFIKQEG